MNNSYISSIAVSESSGQMMNSSSTPIDPSAGTGKIQTLKPVESTMKPEKKEDQQPGNLDTSETKELVKELNDYMNDLQTQLGFFIRDDLNHQVVVEIKNRKTDELVKQIPSEELLAIKEKMEELNGIIFDQSV